MNAYERTGELLQEIIGDGGYERGYWPTPYAAVPPLMPHLPKVFTYCEPCVGNGALVANIAKFRPTAFLTQAYDIHPLISDTVSLDSRTLTDEQLLSPIHGDADYIITNPPWTRSLMTQLIRHFMTLK